MSPWRVSNPLAWRFHEYVRWHWYGRLVCLVRGHRHKFDTYPVRGMCIQCGKFPPRG